ncbi:asparagine synthase (glutamine-hydrolyzing) [Candidatus Kaiserbacteria bacterium]|nr:asparagine synthase (glutamine-hydrolyzing) [Candidatus Kaiserbacteria bacterium]
MCGIAGFAGKESDPSVLRAMADSLARRGPDAFGVWHSKDGHVGLAHTRLAIIDLTDAGAQPMHDASGRYVITFNGEIYNFKALRQELERSYPFKGHSDTEVILAAYTAWGVEAFKRVDGMFAIALYDAHTGELVLARDRMGKKPLYWTLADGVFLFGSELKALMAHPAFRREIDPESVNLFLAYEYVPTPHSIFKGVQKLSPGSFLRYTKGAQPKEEVFWQPPTQRSDMSFEEASQTLDKLLEKSVEQRLVADVPVGVFLSGGIDSSTVAYYAARTLGRRLKTFSISVGFSGSDQGEAGYAAAVAQALGVDLSVEQFSEKECLDLIPEVFAYVDEPLADASILPTYLLSGFTRKHVTVALGGDGADELFAGYPTFDAENLARIYTRLPRIARQQIIEPLIRKLPVSHSYLSLDFKLKKFLDGVSADPRYRHQRWLGAFGPEDIREVLTPAYRTSGFSPYTMLDQYFTGEKEYDTYMNEVLWSYARTYLMDQVLVKVDRASMAHGLEVRAPFLDREMVEFAFSLPYSYKHHGFTGKYLLKKLMAEKLPKAVIQRPKRGFGIPIGRWLQKELTPLSHELLSRQSLEKSGIFDWRVAERLLDEHESGVRDHHKKLWTLLAFQLWYDTWQ